MIRLFNYKWSEKPINRKFNNKKTNLNETESLHENEVNINEDFIENLSVKQNVLTTTIEKTKELEKITSLQEFYEFVNEFENCKLKQTAINTVIYSGEQSPLMIIGEAPGEEEDKQGLPFVGLSGKLIDKELERIGIDRKKVYVSNIVNWRPPENRTPTAEEIEICLPLIKKHIELLNPKVIFILGSVAMKSLLKIDSPITAVRGKLLKYNDIDVIVGFHPSYILRMSSNRVYLQKDMELVKSILEEKGVLHEVCF
jgi:DNA polymerase